MRKKVVMASMATAAAFILAAGVSFAQTTTPSPAATTPTPTPTTTTTMPAGAPNTGFGN